MDLVKTKYVQKWILNTWEKKTAGDFEAGKLG
jgi:hypothetical protein